MCVHVADTADLSWLYVAQSKDSNYVGLWLFEKNKIKFISQGHENSFSCED